MNHTVSRQGLLITLCAIFVVIAAVPSLDRWQKWSDHRHNLHVWASKLKREPSKAEGKSIQTTNGRQLMVSTAEVEFPADFSTSTYAGAPVRSNGFFVVPPGIWVNSIDDVIATWEAHD